MPPLIVAGRITPRVWCAHRHGRHARPARPRGEGRRRFIGDFLSGGRAERRRMPSPCRTRRPRRSPASRSSRDHTEIAPRVRQDCDFGDRRRVSRHISAIYLGVGDGSAGGDDVLDATCRCDVEGVAEGEECVGGERHLPYKASVDRRSTGGISANDCVEIAEWARVTSLSVARNAAFSSRVRSGGGSANCSAHCAASVGAMSPSM